MKPFSRKNLSRNAKTVGSKFSSNRFHGKYGLLRKKWFHEKMFVLQIITLPTLKTYDVEYDKVAFHQPLSA